MSTPVCTVHFTAAGTVSVIFAAPVLAAGLMANESSLMHLIPLIPLANQSTDFLLGLSNLFLISHFPGHHPNSVSPALSCGPTAITSKSPSWLPPCCPIQFIVMISTLLTPLCTHRLSARWFPDAYIIKPKLLSGAFNNLPNMPYCTLQSHSHCGTI